MDKLFKSNWFVKIISFLLALMLYTVVSANQHSPNNSASLLGKSEQSTVVTEDLQVKVDTDKYIVSGAPDKVNVQLKGPSELILKAKLLQSQPAYIDLTGKKAGTYSAKVQADFPSGLKVTPNPGKVTVTVQKKITKTRKVNIDVLNQDSVSGDYTVGAPEPSPGSVQVTGGQDTVNNISFVKGVVDVKNANEDVEQRVKLNAYDRDGNQLDVTINPAYATVKVPIAKTAESFPLNVKVEGKPADGYQIEATDVTPQKVMVYGDQKVLDAIGKLDDVTVNAEGLKDDKTFTVDIPVPKGADHVEPKTAKVKVKVISNKDSAAQKKTSSADTANQTSDSGTTGNDTSGDSSATADSAPSGASDNNDNAAADQQSATRLFKNIPINVNGLDKGTQSIAFLDPDSQAVDVKLTGEKSVIDKTDISDITADINIDGLKNGKHTVPIHLSYPDGLKKGTDQLAAKIELSDASSKDSSKSSSPTTT